MIELLKNQNTAFFPLTVTGFMLAKPPKFITKTLLKEAQTIIENTESATPYNDRLVGALEKSYQVKESAGLLNRLANQISKDYFRHIGNYELYQKDYVLEPSKNNGIAAWFNFQKKYEYNPVHMHDGVLSFVYWLKIPYNLQDEREVSNVKNARSPMGPVFEFVYADTLSPGGVNTHPIPVDSSYEGIVAIFPSFLNHYVLPFYTSDDYRISVAGNIIPYDEPLETQ